MEHKSFFKWKKYIFRNQDNYIIAYISVSSFFELWIIREIKQIIYLLKKKIKNIIY